MPLRRKAFEHVGAGGIGAGLAGFLAPGQAELAKQDLAHLLGRGDVEGLSGQRVNLVFEPGTVLTELGGHAREDLRVDFDPGSLHVDQNVDQRSLHGLVERGHFLRHQSGLQSPVQPHGDIRVLGGVVERLVQRHVVEGHLRLPHPGNLLVGDGLVTEHPLGQLVEAVVVLTAVEHKAEQHGIVDGRDVDVAVPKHGEVVLGVMGDLHHRRVFQQRLEPGQRFGQGDLLGHLGDQVGGAMGQRDVAGLTGFHAQRHPDQFGLLLVQRGGFGVEGHQPRGLSAGDPALQRLDRGHQLIFVVSDGRFDIGARRCYVFTPGARHRSGSGRPRRHAGIAGRRSDFHPQPLGDGLKLHRLKEGSKRFGVVGLVAQIFEVGQVRHSLVQKHQIA